MNTELKKQWELVNFCEFDKYATKSYCAIHDVYESKNLGDITKVDETELDDFNMICGGSPCQDFSVAGKQKGSVWTCKECGHEYNPLTVHWNERDKCPNCGSENIDKTRSSLLVEYLRVVRANKPNFGIYENVKNIVGKQFKDTTFKLFTDELEEYGYNVYWKVLNAKNYGIPQNRERVYLLFIKKDLDNGKFKFPEPFDNGLRLKDLLEDKVDEKFYISDEKTKKFISSIESKYEKSQNDKFVCEERKNEGLRTYKNDVCGDKRVVEIDQPKFIGNVNREDFGTGYAGGVWDDSHISPTLTTMQGGGRQPHVITGIDKSYNNPKFIEIANCITSREDRGISNRKSEGTAVLKIGNINPSGNGMNGSVYSEEGLSPTLTSRDYKDPRLVNENVVRQIGNIVNTGNLDNPQRGRIYSSDGCSPSLNCCGGGELEPKIVTGLVRNQGEEFTKETDCANTLLARDYKGFGNQEMNCVIENNKVAIKQATKQGYIECEVGGVADLSYPDSKTRRGRVQNNGNVSPTITATETGICRIESPIRIRKLTPKECFRLMGFSDENFDAAQKVGISNSQLYKQAGNSIVADVLYYIYVELYKAMPYLFDDLKLSSFFSGIGAFEIALDKLYKGINSGNFINPQTE